MRGIQQWLTLAVYDKAVVVERLSTRSSGQAPIRLNLASRQRVQQGSPIKPLCLSTFIRTDLLWGAFLRYPGSVLDEM